MIRKRFKDKHIKEILHGSAIAFLLKASGSILSFLVTLLMVRTLGAEGAGSYFLSFTLVTVVASFSRLGMDGALVRFSAICWENRDIGSLSYLARSAIGIVLLSSFIASLILYLLSPWLATTVFDKPTLSIPLATMSLGTTFFSLTLIMAQMLKGVKKIRDSQLLEAVLVPGLIIIGVWFLSGIWGGEVEVAAYSFLIATFVAAVTGFVFTYRIWRPRPADLPEVNRNRLLKTSFTLLGVTSVNMLTIAAAPIFLGRFGMLEDVTIYTIASKAAFLTAILLTSVSSIAASKFSTLYAQGKLRQLERAVRQINFLLTLIAAPILIAYFVFAEEIIELFGTGLEAGVPVLMILAVGQFISVSSGSVGQLLIMSGHEKEGLRMMVIIGILNILLNFMLIPFMGVIGAAIATAVTLIVRNFYAIHMTKRLLGISVSYLLPLGSSRTTVS